MQIVSKKNCICDLNSFEPFSSSLRNDTNCSRKSEEIKIIHPRRKLLDGSEELLHSLYIPELIGNERRW